MKGQGMLKYTFVFASEERTFELVAAGNPGTYRITIETATHQGTTVGPVLPEYVVSDGSSPPENFSATAPIGTLLFDLGYLAHLDLYMLQYPGPPEVTVAVEQIA